MGINDKMIADQVWVRPHSTAERAPQKSIGQYFFIYQAPNFRERIEMSFRALGRQFDWDLEKYRMSRKPADRGNRRRLLRNIVRFIKNPAGYFIWKTWKWNRHPRLLLILLVISFPWYLMECTDVSHHNQKKMHWVKIQGGTRPESFLQRGEDRSSKRNVPMTFLWQLIYAKLPGSYLVANPTYNQNYRLYFDRMPYGQF